MRLVSIIVQIIRSGRILRILTKLVNMLNAKVRLRRVNQMGRRVRLTGRVKMRNQGFIRLGDQVRLNGDTVRLEFFVYPEGRLEVGDATTIDYGSTISAVKSVKIGKHCILSAYTRILDSDFHDIDTKADNFDADPITIGDYVWFGPRVTILKGVTIGDHAIVTANSVVTRDVPARTIVTGVPARVIRHIEGPQSLGQAKDQATEKQQSSEVIP